jgi:hypothetical protein
MVYLTSTGVAASTANLFISTSNNVGIGTTSPGYGLTVTTAPANATGRTLEVAPSMSGTAGTGECVSRMYFTDSGITECGIRVGVKNVSNPGNLNYPLQAYYNGTAVLSVTSSNNVGIGTTSPTKPLVVNRVAAGGNNNPAIMIGNNGVSSGLRFQTYDLTADAAGFMGLGTDMGIGSYEHSLVFPVGGTAGKQTIGSYDGTTYSTKMTILNNGNVGIGTTTPGYTLDVNGSMNVATVSSTTGLMFRNRIINGDFRIDQRNNGASFTVSASGTKTYTLDRWWGWCAVGSKFSVQQSAVVPTGQGITGSVLVTSLSAYSTPVGGYYGFGQYIEGYNIADMWFGTASATMATLSFWARSSLTGTFSVALENGSFNRSYIFNYTISSVNTWQYFTLPFRADTTGTWDATTGQGLRLWWDLGSNDTTYAGAAGSWLAADKLRTTGSVSLIGTNAATLYLAGVQLEKGSVATPFEIRPYATELALCQRYYEIVLDNFTNNYAYGMGYYPGGSATNLWFNFKVTKRATPTLANGTVASGGGSGGGTIGTIWFTPQYVSWAITAAGGGLFFYVLSNPPLSFSAEL